MADTEKSKAMPKWVRQKGRQASRMAGLKDVGVFDKVNYWRWIRHLGELYYQAPSRIKELLPIKGRKFTAVVCYNGEIVVLENTLDSQQPPKVEWSTKVTKSNSENEPTRLRHAAYDSLHAVLFFTVDFTSVCYAKMADLEANARAGKVTELITMIESSNPKEPFHGLAADAENGVLYVCANNCVQAWTTVKLDQPKKLADITFSTSVTPTIKPYKVAVHLDIHGSKKALMAVADKEQSTLSQLKVKYEKKSLGLGQLSGISYEFISTLAVKGSKLGSISKPQGIHFDPAGNLLVADDKNLRIQVFPFASDGSRALDAADGELIVIKDMFSMLKTVAVGTAGNDRPLVLVGLCGPFGKVGSRKIMRLTYTS